MSSAAASCPWLLPASLRCSVASTGSKKPQPGQRTGQWGICAPSRHTGQTGHLQLIKKTSQHFPGSAGKQFRKPNTGSCRGGSCTVPGVPVMPPLPGQLKECPASGRFKCPRGGIKIGLSLSAEFCKNWERTRWDHVWEVCFFFLKIPKDLRKILFFPKNL